MFKVVAVFKVLTILVVIYGGSTLANKTNVNQVTDFFDQNVSDRRRMEQEMEAAKGSAITGIRQNQLLSGSPGKDEVSGKVNELTSIDAHDLEGAARRSKEYAEFHRGDEEGKGQFLIDHNSAGIRAHKRDVEEIASASEALMSRLTEGLRQHAIDCQEVGGRRELNQQWFIDIQKSTEKEVIYDKFYCEHRRNKYSCYDDLSLQCLHLAEQAADFHVSSSNMTYRLIATNPVKKYSFEANYDGGGSNRFGGGRVHGFINKASGTTYNAIEGNWYINFYIGNNVATLNRIEITGLNYGTFVMIKVNSRVAFVGPTGGSNLYLSGHIAVESEGKKKYGGRFGKRVTVTTHYPQVVTGYRDYALGHSQVSVNSWGGTININPYIRQGSNSIEVKAISLNSNRVSFSLDVSERICLNWQENWSERCSLTITQP